MKQFLKSILLMAFLMPLALHADEITIGTETTSGSISPFNNAFNYSWTECIYPASSINTPCVINSIAFQCATSYNYTCSDLKIYIGTRTSATYSTTSDWTPKNDLTLVYSTENEVVGATTGWNNFSLQSPYIYDGVDNLVIVVSKKSDDKSTYLRWNYTAATNTCLGNRSRTDASFADYPDGRGTRNNNRANVKLNVTPVTITCEKPLSVEAGAITPLAANISWTPCDNTSAWDVYIGNSADVAPHAGTVPTASGLTTTLYTFTDLTSSSFYNCYVRSNCGNGDFSAWRGISIMTVPDFSGNGSQESPYLIYSVSEMEALRLSMTMGWSTKGKYFRLMHDIETVTNPIASTVPFYGDFDGNGYTVFLDLNGTANQALFAIVGPGANIHDLTTDGTVVNTGRNTGGIVASINTFSETIDNQPIHITNCVNKADITSDGIFVGGICAYYYGRNAEVGSHLIISGCTNRGDISGEGSTHGGIIGYNCYYGVIENCLNKGSVSGSNYVGGIAARNHLRCEIKNSSNRGDVTATTEYSGGITGNNNGSVIYNCYNIGTVTAENYCGGITGYNFPYNYADYGRVENVYNAGVVTGGNTDNCGSLIGLNANYNTSCYAVINGAYFNNNTCDIAFGNLSDTDSVNYVSAFTQDGTDPTICTLQNAGIGGTTDLLAALNNWRDGNTDYNEWMVDIYGNNSYFPTFNPGNPAGLEITPNPLSMEARPIGAWMHGESFTLTNTGEAAITISNLDFANSEFFILDEMANNPEMPISIEEDESVDIVVTTNMDANVNEGAVSGSFLAFWGQRNVSMADINATAYLPIAPDVVETPTVVTSFPYVSTQNTSAIYNNYNLPGEKVDGIDGVYKMTFDNDVALNAAVVEGSNAKIALYTEDFGGNPGPSTNNYYTGPVIGAGSGFEEFVFDQSEMITHPGQGAGGADVSAICGGASYFGPNVNWAAGNGEYYLIADDFVCDSAVTINRMEFYGYQTGSNIASTMTGLYIQIYDGNPMDSAQVIWGDNATNLLLTTSWTGIYRTNAIDFTNDQRPIMRLVAGGMDINLEAGTYWVSVGFTGSMSSGPWGASRSIWNEAANGNGVQKDTRGWSEWLDAGQQAMPMIIKGSYGHDNRNSDYVESMTSKVAAKSLAGFGSIESYEKQSPVDMSKSLQNSRDEYPVCFGGDEPITNLTVKAGTYYLVASSTSAKYVLNVNPVDIPLPLEPSPVYPADGEQNIVSPVTLRWNLGKFTTEYQLVIGTTYPPTEVVVDWTDDLVHNYGVGYLLNNKNYFWRVNERNSSGVTYGPVWGFTTMMNIPQSLIVENTNLYEGENAVLTWTGVDDRSHRGYNVYQDGVKINDNILTETTYTVENLAYNMIGGYTFTITAVYDEGESTYSNSVRVYVTGKGSLNGTIYEQDSITVISGVTVSLSGNDEFGVAQYYSFTTDDNGDFSGDVYAGNYHATASMGGYQDAAYNGSIDIDYNTNTSDVNFILTENYAPVGHVVAEEIDDERVKIYWESNSVSKRGDERSFQYYNVYRTNCYNTVYTEENTLRLVSNITDTVYMDMSWNNAEAGVYKWGVSVQYAGNRESNITWNKSENEQRSTIAYGVCLYSISVPNGFVSFEIENPSNATQLNGDVRVYGGDYYDGYLYAFSNSNVFYKINIETGAVENQMNVSDFPVDCAYDYSTNTMYGINGNILYSINLANGSMTEVAALDQNLMVIGINMNGDIYGIANITGDFYSINKNTGVCTLIGATGKSCNYVQSGGFDHATGTFYWCQCSSPDDMGLYSVDVNTGAATLIASGTGEITSFFVPFTNNITAPGESPIAWSNCMDKNMDTQVDVTVTTNSGDSVEGTEVSFTNISEPELHLSYDIDMDNTGYYSWDEFRKGTYIYSISLDGFESCAYNDTIEIWDVTSVDCTLEEMTTAINGLYVSNTGWAMWNVANEMKDIESFKVFIDDDFEANTETAYYQHDVTYLVEGQQYTTSVSVVYSTGMSELSDYTWTYIPCDNYDGVESVNAEYINGNALISWEGMPEDDVKANRESTWLGYDDGTFVDGIGTGGSELYWAIMFPSTMMGYYNGYTLTKINMYDKEAFTGDVMIYQGGATAPATLVHTQEVSFAGTATDVDVDLTEPVLLDVTQNLWIVIHCDFGAYPASAGNDTGDPNGRWISVDGTTWADLTYLVPGFNWTLRAYVDEGTPISTGSILGVFVYRDGELLTTTPVSEMSYTDENVTSNETEYCVRVVYGDAEVGNHDADWYSMSCPQCTTLSITSVEDNRINAVSIYPNPTNDKMNIKADGMTRITITTVLGQVIYDQAVETDNAIIDMNNFGEGVYMVRIVTNNGSIVKRVTVIE